jgi:IclR family transcriptional regulator, pca regulon regulatory protein
MTHGVFRLIAPPLDVRITNILVSNTIAKPMKGVSRTLPADRTTTNATHRRETMLGLAKGLAIIEGFRAKPAMTIAEAAAVSSATRAAARRCLLTLVELGYVEIDGKSFRPLPRLSRLGGNSNTASLPRLAQPILDRLRDAMQESISLAVLEGDEVLFVGVAHAIRIVSTGEHLGGTLPAAITATGRVLLASLPDRELTKKLSATAVTRRTPKTTVSIGGLRKVIADIRTRGYAVNDEELELGLRALAVPVVDHSGTTVAAISVSAHSARVTAAYMVRQFLPLLRRHASVLGRML